MGSVLFLTSWAVLLGPITYGKHLLSGPRLPFTAVYFGSIGLTLFFAIGVSRFFSLLCEHVFGFSLVRHAIVLEHPVRGRARSLVLPSPTKEEDTQRGHEKREVVTS